MILQIRQFFCIYIFQNIEGTVKIGLKSQQK